MPLRFYRRNFAWGRGVRRSLRRRLPHMQNLRGAALNEKLSAVFYTAGGAREADTDSAWRTLYRERWGYSEGPAKGSSWVSFVSGLKRMEIRRVTPRSCMVTPYIVSAAETVFLLWEITRNCE